LYVLTVLSTDGARVAVNAVALLTVVGRGVPFNSATVVEVNPLPVIATVLAVVLRVKVAGVITLMLSGV
jgi:hypothetical protein